MKIRILLALSALMLSVSCQKDFEPTQSPPEEDAMVQGTIRMKLDRETANALRITRTRSGELATGNLSFDELCQRYHIIEMKRLFEDNGCAERTRESGLDLWYTITFEGNSEQIKQDFGRVPGVTHVEVPLRIKRAYKMHAEAASPSVLVFGAQYGTHAVPADYPFNDPMFDKQWPLYNDGSINTNAVSGADINVIPAWQQTAGRSDVIVAVVDEGVQYNHPDLEANMWSGIGRNFCGGDNSTISWGEGHGTHVAGTIAAVNNNGVGISGIAGGSGKGDGVKIMSCQIFHPTNGAYDADSDQTAQAIKYAADNGAVICQNSWGYAAGAFSSESQWVYYDLAIKEAIDYFVTYAGMSPDGKTQTGPMAGGIVTFAAGNEYSGQPAYPAAYSACISVAAISCNYEAAIYTNYGTTVDIAAPGGGAWASSKRDIPYAQGYNLSTIPTDLYNGQNYVYTTYEGYTQTVPIDYVESTGYGYMQGTSMACPHVSGVAALIVSQFGQSGFTQEQCKEILLGTGRNIDSYQPFRYSGKIGLLVDAAAALGHDTPPAPEAPTITPASGQSDSFSLTTGDTKSLTYTLGNYTDWSLNDASGQVESSLAEDVVTLTFDGSRFAPGKYTVELIATNETSRATRTITCTVTEPSAATYPTITPAQGQPDSFTMAPDEVRMLQFTLTDFTQWSLQDETKHIKSVLNGSTLTLTIDASQYEAGTYTARIEASNENGSVTHTITYTIEKSSGTPDQDSVTMSLFPNPFVDVLKLQVNRSGSATIRIRNSVGLEVMNRTVVFAKDKPVALDVADFASGAYLVDLDYNGERYSRTVIKK